MATTGMLEMAYLVLLVHEWSFRDDGKMFCQSCGIVHRDTVKKLSHHPGCAWKECQELIKKELKSR